MNLRDFHYLLAIAETGSFNRAAELCHVSQPTLSMQIKKLEAYLGVRLFERTNKSVVITEAGQRIAAAAQQAIDAERHIRDIAREARDPRAGEFRLGAMPTLASYIFPAYLALLNKAFPKLTFLLIEEKTERLIAQLKASKIDAALLALPVDDAALTALPLFDDPFLLTVSATHSLAKKKAARLEDLTNQHLLLLDDGHCLRDQALSVCHAHGANEEKSFRATSLETLRLMVQADDRLMTLMPAIAATPTEGLRYIPFAGTKPSRRIGLVCRNTSARAEIIAEMAGRLCKNHRRP